MITAVLTKPRWFYFLPQDVTVAGDKIAQQDSSIFPSLNKFETSKNDYILKFQGFIMSVLGIITTLQASS